MAGTFRVESAFPITDRGLTIGGQVSSGTVQAGGMVTVPDPGGKLLTARVTAVEAGHARDDRGEVHGFVGLILGDLALSDVPLFLASLVRGLELVVTDPEP